MKKEILGYEDIQVVRAVELAPGKNILLYEDAAAPIYKFGILFENPYKGQASYTAERGGAYTFKTMDEAISEFAGRIAHYLKHTIGSLTKGV